ncbi:MAG TPA: iron-containing alcohol dehydrogenase, partial [Candidatus Angelobacter sp.]|nr:iron-containing alcohol dehydrogenase [Candidatus Angelobacter sp.]
QANLIALHERDPRDEAVRRYVEVARLLTGSERAGAAEGIAWIGHLCAHLQIQPLRRHGIAAGDFSALIGKAANASSMKANPIQLTSQEMHEILERAF